MRIQDVDEMLEAARPQFLKICQEMYQNYIEDKKVDPFARYVAFTILQGLARASLMKDARMPNDEMANEQFLIFLESVAHMMTQKVDMDRKWDDVKGKFSMDRQKEKK